MLQKHFLTPHLTCSIVYCVLTFLTIVTLSVIPNRSSFFLKFPDKSVLETLVSKTRSFSYILKNISIVPWHVLTLASIMIRNTSRSISDRFPNHSTTLFSSSLGDIKKTQMSTGYYTSVYLNIELFTFYGRFAYLDVVITWSSIEYI